MNKEFKITKTGNGYALTITAVDSQKYRITREKEFPDLGELFKEVKKEMG